MERQTQSDVIIIGGSYAGLSAAMSLGRSLRNVLIIDSGKPCNAQTPHSHNFITHDGETPAAIAARAREQVLAYPTVRFIDGTVTHASGTDGDFTVVLESGQAFKTRKLLFASGVRDIMPPVKGFAECWGISVLHCPYCHGYEVKGQATGILSNGDMGFELAGFIQHWAGELTLLTNGPATLTDEQAQKLTANNILIEERQICELEHQDGRLIAVHFNDGASKPMSALYARCAMEQHCAVPETMGCALTEHGLLQTDEFRRTNIAGIYAAGDCITLLRSVAFSVASGSTAGAFLNKDMVTADFSSR